MAEAAQFEATLPRWLVIGFSGHRHLNDKAQVTDKRIREKIEKLAEQHPMIGGVSSAASGADTLFARAILDRSEPLWLVLPFHLARFERDFHGEPDLPDGKGSAWAAAQEIIAAVPRHRTDVVHQLEADLADITERQWTSKQRADEEHKRNSDAYFEATVRTVDHADVLLAVWNEKPGRGRGGAADAVKYATERNIPVIIYNPDIDRFTRDESDALQKDCVAQRVDTSKGRALVAEQLAHYGQTASRHRQPTKSLMQLCIYLHLVASALAAFAVLFVKTRWPALFPAAFEVIALFSVLVVLAVRGMHHHLWFTSRVAAEICRTFQSTWDIRRHASLIHQPRQPIADHLTVAPEKKPPWILRLLQSLLRKAGYKPPDEEDTIDPQSLFRRLRLLREVDPSPPPDQLDVVRDRYVDERLNGKSGQLAYFTRMLAEARCDYKRYKSRASMASVAAGLSAITVLILLSLDTKWENATHVFEYLGIVMPLVATASTFLMVSSDATRRVHRYDQMISILHALIPKVKAAPTWDALARAVTEVEEELLQEIVEWQSFVHYTEHLH